MRLRKGKRILAFALAVLMIITSISVKNWGMNTAKAEEADATVYELKGSDIGAKVTSNQEGVGTSKYFNLLATAEKAVDYDGAKAKTFDDGKSYDAVLKMGSGNVYNQRAIEFTVTAGATASVDVYGVASGGTKDVNYTNIAVYDAAGAVVKSVKVGAGITPVTTFEGLAAGTYYITDCKTDADTADYKGVNVYSVVVKESKSAGSENEGSKSEAFELTGLDVGAKITANKEGIGTNKYFNVLATAEKAVDYDGAKAKTFDDDKTYDAVLKMGSGNVYNQRAIEFTVTSGATATVDVYGVASGGTKDVNYTNIAIYDAAGAVVKSVKVGAGITPVTTFEGLAAGTYYISDCKTDADTADYKGLNVYAVVVNETKSAEPVKEEFELTGLDVGAKITANKEGIGTNKFFNVLATAEKAVDYDGAKPKTFDDGKTYDAVLKMGSGNVYNQRAIEFTVAAGATASVDVYGIASGGTKDVNYTNIAVYDAAGAVVKSVKVGAGITPVTTFEGLAAGTYYISDCKTDADTADYKGLNVYAVRVTQLSGGSAPVEKTPWADVVAPELGTPTLKENAPGTIVIPYKMVIDANEGAEYVEITVFDKTGKSITTLTSTAKGTEGSKEYTPSESGKYIFTINAFRAGEEAKSGNTVVFDNFAYPLSKSTINMLYNKGKGSVALEWSAVKEATSYAVEYTTDGSTWTSKNAGTALTATVSGLTIGSEYQFRVVAKRGEDSTVSAVSKVKVVEEAQTPWGHIVYGNGANANNAKVTGDLNADGKVTLSSGKVYQKLVDGKLQWTAESNNGKWVPASFDGIQFYYTTVPSSMNFTLRAKVTVEQWWLSNAQEAWGLMANDKLGGTGWNNSYSAYVSKNEYYWNGTEVTTDTTAQKVTQKLGIGSQEKIGVTADNLALIEGGDTATIQSDFKASTYPLEQRYPNATNIIGNGVNSEADNGAAITEMYLQIQKNNTGYFVTYESVDGSYKVTKKYYDTEALSKIDAENVYVGFFMARYGTATFSDVTFTTIDPSLDAPAEERPKEVISVNTTVQSPTATGSSKYEFVFSANCDGTLTIKDAAGKVVAENVAVKVDTPVKAGTVDLAIGKNNYVLTFTPDANYAPDEFSVMETYEPIEIKHTVSYAVYGKAGQSIWVAPDATGIGTKADPMSIYEAVKYVQPGQTIVIKEGTYNLQKTIKVERGIDGTADNKIYMIADPDAATRPVFDFGGYCAGMVIAGDYWVFKGFDVTNSQNAQKGMQISGNYNLVDNIHAYKNGNTGIQISRYLTTDKYADWPSYNTILNCEAWDNADKGFEDADGFAAKLTVADGNVFDGCISHHNADDGWDLFAKVQDGAIGSVTIRNCVAYANGYLSDGTVAGNGNGFKMGGDSISGKHVLENSVAYDNKAKGIDSNSCPDIIVKNSISFNNGSYNVALYTNTAANTDYVVDNVVSFRFDKSKAVDLTVGENIKPVGTQDTSKIYKDTNYFWDPATGTSANKSGATVSLDWFENLDTSTALTRNADGSINMNGLLVLTDKAPAELKDAGMKGTASEAIVVPPSITADGVKTGDSTPIALYVVLALMSFAVLGGVAFFGFKKFAK